MSNAARLSVSDEVSVTEEHCVTAQNQFSSRFTPGITNRLGRRIGLYHSRYSSNFLRRYCSGNWGREIVSSCRDAKSSSSLSLSEMTTRRFGAVLPGVVVGMALRGLTHSPSDTDTRAPESTASKRSPYRRSPPQLLPKLRRLDVDAFESAQSLSAFTEWREGSSTCRGSSRLNAA